MSNLPAIKTLYATDLSVIAKQDEFVALMNQPPAKEWVKKHPFISNYNYLPIERIEFLLKSIFKSYKIEITGQGTAYNGVWVTVRVHYVHPVTKEWLYHDGIGAAQLQLRAQTVDEKQSKTKVLFSSENINNGAVAMAFPLAKTVAVKDACDHFGKLFGSDLNRKDEINYAPDLTLRPLDDSHPNWSKACSAVKAGTVTVEQIKVSYDLTEESENYLNTLQNERI